MNVVLVNQRPLIRFLFMKCSINNVKQFMYCTCLKLKECILKYCSVCVFPGKVDALYLFVLEFTKYGHKSNALFMNNIRLVSNNIISSHTKYL